MTDGNIVGAGVRIRGMRESDLREVLRIERASFAVPWTPATFLGLLRRPDAHLFVAEAALSSGGPEGATVATVDTGSPRRGVLSVVGYAAVWIVLDQAELGDIAVAADWRRRGIGQLLLEAVLERMREKRVRELFLEVRLSNVNARRLYERNGFLQVGRRRNYYTRPREDALVLRRLVEGGRPF